MAFSRIANNCSSPPGHRTIVQDLDGNPRCRLLVPVIVFLAMKHNSSSEICRSCPPHEPNQWRFLLEIDLQSSLFPYCRLSMNERHIKWPRPATSLCVFLKCSPSATARSALDILILPTVGSWPLLPNQEFGLVGSVARTMSLPAESHRLWPDALRLFDSFVSQQGNSSGDRLKTHHGSTTPHVMGSATCSKNARREMSVSTSVVPGGASPRLLSRRQHRVFAAPRSIQQF